MCVNSVNHYIQLNTVKLLNCNHHIGGVIMKYVRTATMLFFESIGSGEIRDGVFTKFEEGSQPSDFGTVFTVLGKILEVFKDEVLKVEHKNKILTITTETGLTVYRSSVTTNFIPTVRYLGYQGELVANSSRIIDSYIYRYYKETGKFRLNFEDVREGVTDIIKDDTLTLEDKAVILCKHFNYLTNGKDKLLLFIANTSARYEKYTDAQVLYDLLAEHIPHGEVTVNSMEALLRIATAKINSSRT